MSSFILMWIVINYSMQFTNPNIVLCPKHSHSLSCIYESLTQHSFLWIWKCSHESLVNMVVFAQLCFLHSSFMPIPHFVLFSSYCVAKTIFVLSSYFSPHAIWFTNICLLSLIVFSTILFWHYVLRLDWIT